MYKAFYGLNRQPFDNTPNPEFFFASKQHREALAALVYGIENSKGFMLVTGEVGSGKTFLIQSLKYELEEQNHIILEVATPWITPEELFAELPAKLGMDMTPEWGSLVFQNNLKAHLTRLHEQGRRVLVILDEAQQLPERTLEGIRLLSNFETAEAKLIQIIFLGQNELVDMLSRYSMRQIRQRITLSRSLGYFNEDETVSYISHRLKIAGRHLTLFDHDAMSAIYRYSGGSPRLINQICDNALITGFAQSAPIITADVIDDVASDLPNVDLVNHAPKVKKVTKVTKRKTSAEKETSQAPSPQPTVKTPPKLSPTGLRTEEVGVPNGSESGGSDSTSSTGRTLAYDEEYEQGPDAGKKSSLWFWLILILLLVVGWFLADWYQESNKKEAEVEQEALTLEQEMARSSMTTEHSLPAVPSLDMQDTPTNMADPTPSRATTTSASNGYPSVAQVDVQELSLFERLRREAKIVDGYDEPASMNSQMDSAPSTRTNGMAESMHAQDMAHTKPMMSDPKPEIMAVSKPVIVDERLNRKDIVSSDGDIMVIDLPKGVLTSSRPPPLYESQKRYTFPIDANLDEMTVSAVSLGSGETMSQRAREKYGTWNDTVQDIVKAANPQLPSDLNLVMSGSKINFPNITRSNLLIENDRGHFAYMGTLTSRLKANHLYQAVKDMSQPVDLEVLSKSGRRYYRVFAGPFNSEESATTFLQGVRMTHMPFLD